MSGSGKTNVPTLGGWVVTVLLGVVVFFVLRHSFKFHDLSAAGFGLAVSLIMLLLLTGSGPVEDPDANRVRKIVPAPEFLPPIKPAVVPNRVTSAVRAEVPAPKIEDAPAAVADVPKVEAAAEPVKAAGPQRLSAPRGGKADDLKALEGVGPALEKLLNGLGIYHYDQVAAWTDADVAAVDDEMPKFKGRITRDRWVAQAKIIMTEGLEAFKERAKTNNY